MIDTINLSNILFQCNLNSYKYGINLSTQVADIITKYKESRPFHFNVIEAVCHGSFKETGHSLILANMLKNKQIQKSFLERFLSIKSDYLEVTAETDRVDVALKGDNIFVIIENKVNGAIEQKSQVYRYVHKIGIDQYGYNMDQIYVVYLNPTDRTTPSNESLCDENKKNNVFDDLGTDHYSVLSYKYDVLDWLRKITIDNEPHISSALDQYIDFLEHKFNISLLDEKMNSDIKNILFEELQIKNKSFEEQIEVLENQKEKVQDLLNTIDNVKNELKTEHSNRTIREWQEQIESSLHIKFHIDNHCFRIRLKNNVWLGIWDGNDSSEKRPYWGFQYTAYRSNNESELDKNIESILKKSNFDLSKINKDSGWIAWNYTWNGIFDFQTLYHAAKDERFLD